MALIRCYECGREISDRAQSCPGCGAPVSLNYIELPTYVTYDGNYVFTGTMALMVNLAMNAIQQLGWKIDQADAISGLVTFQTKRSWGSNSGISGTLFIQEVAQNKFTVTGSAKQNLSGMQAIAFNLFGEAESKISKAIEKMISLSSKQF